MRKIPKSIYIETAKEMNLDDKLVKNVVDFAYKELIHHMGHSEYPYLYLTGLGQFNTTKKRLNKKIDIYEEILINNIFNKSYKSVKIYNRTVNAIARLKALKYNIDKESQRKYETRKRYYESLEKENKKNIQ